MFATHYPEVYCSAPMTQSHARHQEDYWCISARGLKTAVSILKIPLCFAPLRTRLITGPRILSPSSSSTVINVKLRL